MDEYASELAIDGQIFPGSKQKQKVPRP